MNDKNHIENSVKKKSFNKMKRLNIEYGFARISLLIAVPIYVILILWLVFGPRSTISQIEKRELNKFPEFSFETYLKGDFTKGITNWFDDTVPYHDDMKNLGNNFKSLFGFSTESGVNIIGPVNVVDNSKPEKPSPSQENSKPSEVSAVESSSEASTSENSNTNSQTSSEPEEISYNNGIIVLKQNGHYRAMELFGGGSGKNYINALNNFHKDLGDSVTIYSMPVPLASEYYVPNEYAQYSASQKECFNNIASQLDKGIISVDADAVISQHTNEDIYCRTDHHWQPLGAYYAAQAFASAANLDFKDISTYQKFENKGFVGTMYAFSKDAHILNDPETFTYYKPSNIDKCKTYYYDTEFKSTGSGNFFNLVDTPNSYLVFMGGDEQIIKVKTDVKNGRKLCIVKDSYGNAEVPYYMGSFEEIYVVDMRYFKPNLVDFVKQTGVTDLLFSMCSYSVVGENAENLENLRTQAKGKPIVDDAT